METYICAADMAGLPILFVYHELSRAQEAPACPSCRLRSAAAPRGLADYPSRTSPCPSCQARQPCEPLTMPLTMLVCSAEKQQSTLRLLSRAQQEPPRACLLCRHLHAYLANLPRLLSRLLTRPLSDAANAARARTRPNYRCSQGHCTPSSLYFFEVPLSRLIKGFAHAKPSTKETAEHLRVTSPTTVCAHRQQRRSRARLLQEITNAFTEITNAFARDHAQSLQEITNAAPARALRRARGRWVASPRHPTRKRADECASDDTRAAPRVNGGLISHTGGTRRRRA